MADNEIEVTLEEIFGTGIRSIEQTTISDEPGGVNILTITLTNDTTYTFTVRNGKVAGLTESSYDSLIVTDSDTTAVVPKVVGDAGSQKINDRYLNVSMVHQPTSTLVDDVIQDQEAYEEWDTYGAYSRQATFRNEDGYTKESLYFPVLDSNGKLSKTNIPAADSTYNGGVTFNYDNQPGGGWVRINNQYIPTLGQNKDTGLIRAKYLPNATASVKGAVIVDTALDNDSTNVVQNKAIKAALDECYRSATEGITPEITTEAITGGTRVNITIGTYETYFDVLNGTDGEDAVNPVVATATTAADMTDTTKVYVYCGSETGYVNGDWYYYDGDSWEDGGAYNATALVTDTTLTQSGKAADAKATGDAITILNSAISAGSNLRADIKSALLACFQNVAWANANGQTYYDALQTALSANLASISAVYTQSGTVYTSDSLDELKSDLVVTATYDDSSTAVLSDDSYTLSGTLTEGTSTITVTYGTKTATFTVTVSTQRLPSEYTEVQYLVAAQITQDRGAFIDTGISFSNPTTGIYRVGFEPVAYSGTWTSGQYPIGTRQTNTGASNNLGFGFNIATSQATGMGAWSGAPGAYVVPSDWYAYHEAVATWTASSVSTILDNETSTSSQATRACDGYHIGLFGIPSAKTAGEATFIFNGKIYYAQIEQDGELLFDGIPCVRNLDSAVGIYDVVNQTFIVPSANSSSGSASVITAGPVVS